MFNLIKQIFQKNKNAYIVVVENEKPVAVIQSFEEYQKIFGGNLKQKEIDDSDKDDSGKDNLDKTVDNSANDSFNLVENKDEDELERLNREIMSLQSPSEFGAEMPEGGRREAGTAGVEDIPVM
jgi:hypothetical protein